MGREKAGAQPWPRVVFSLKNRLEYSRDCGLTKLSFATFSEHEIGALLRELLPAVFRGCH